MNKNKLKAMSFLAATFLVSGSPIKDIPQTNKLVINNNHKHVHKKVSIVTESKQHSMVNVSGIRLSNKCTWSTPSSTATKVSITGGYPSNPGDCRTIFTLSDYNLPTLEKIKNYQFKDNVKLIEVPKTKISISSGSWGISNIDTGKYNIKSFNNTSFANLSDTQLDFDDNKYLVLSGEVIVNYQISEYTGLPTKGTIEKLVYDADELSDAALINYVKEHVLNEIVFKEGTDVRITSNTLEVGKLGTFEVVFSYTDKFNDSHTYTLNIIVGGTLIENNTYNLYVSLGQIEESEIKSLFNAADIFGTQVEMILKESDYQKDVEGVYTITYTATDMYGNSADLVVKVTNIDNRPVISSKTDSDLNNIKIRYSAEVKPSDFSDLIEVREKSSNAIIENPRIESDKPFDTTTVGVQEYTLKVYSGQFSTVYSTVNINIEVIQDLPPVFYVSNKVVLYDSSNPLTLDVFRSIVATVYNVNPSLITNLKVDLSSFSAKNKECNLSFSCKIGSTKLDGESIRIVNKLGDTKPTKPSFIERATQKWNEYFRSGKSYKLYEYIKYFFTWLFYDIWVD